MLGVVGVFSFVVLVGFFLQDRPVQLEAVSENSWRLLAIPCDPALLKTRETDALAAKRREMLRSLMIDACHVRYGLSDNLVI